MILLPRPLSASVPAESNAPFGNRRAKCDPIMIIAISNYGGATLDHPSPSVEGMETVNPSPKRDDDPSPLVVAASLESWFFATAVVTQRPRKGSFNPFSVADDHGQ